MSAPDHPALPSAVAERLHVFVASFLPPTAADELVAAVAARLGPGDTDTGLVFRVAHEELEGRLDVPTDIEVAVLLEDVGLTLAETAHAVGLPERTVLGIADAEGIDVHPEPAPEPPAVRAPEPSPEPAPPLQPTPADPEPLTYDDGPPPLFDEDIPGAPRRAREPRPDRRTRTMLFAVIGVLVALVIAVALANGDQAPSGRCTATADEPVCVAGSRLTDVIDASGTPGAARSAFSIGDTVKLWFAFETFDDRQAYTVDYVWYRGDQALYASSFQLPPGGRVNLSLARPFATEEGTYAVEVRNGDDLLIREEFGLR